RRLVVAAFGKTLDRLRREHVVAAVHPERDLAAFAKAAHDIRFVDVDEPELRPGARDSDRCERAAPAMCSEQRREVDVDELVAVEREQVSVLVAAPRSELDPASAPEPLRLLRRHDLRPEALKLRLEQVPLAG